MLRSKYTQSLRLLFQNHCLLCTLPLGSTGQRRLLMPNSNRKSALAKSHFILCAECRTDWLGGHKQVRWRCQRCKVAVLGDGESLHLDCMSCRDRPLALAQLAVAFDYAAPVDSLVWRLKSFGQFRLAPVLAELMLEVLRADSWVLPADTWVVAIPSRRQALCKRGFNPAAELGRYVAQGLGLRWAPSAIALAQPAHAQAQKHRTQNQRWQYAQRAFQWCSTATPKTLLVIDDVLTTGSTLHGAALCAQAHGVHQVYGLALARTPWLNE